MSGPKPDKNSPARDPRRPVGGGDCDQRFRIDLMGVRSAQAARLRPGDLLQVVLLYDGDLRAVVCQTDRAETVGALSAFPGLSQLIECMEGGATYSAIVERSSPQACGVFVSRSNG